MDNAQLVNQDSGNTNWWTQKRIVGVAKTLMGGYIDVDPACSDEAWEYQDEHSIWHYSEKGLERDWFGNVWMNHPFSRKENPCKPGCEKKTCIKRGHCITERNEGNAAWINKLVDSYYTGLVNQACCITFASLSEKWFQPLFDFPIFFFDERIKYVYSVTGLEVPEVTKGSCFTWLYDKTKIGKIEAAKILDEEMHKAGYGGHAMLRFPEKVDR